MLLLFLFRPMNFPDKPLYGRMSPEVKMGLREPAKMTRDDEIHIVGSCFMSCALGIH
jgi:hypothetical protein